MTQHNLIEPIDYMVIGHITQDVTPTGLTLGGTVAYASLTALALGLRVGIVTSCDVNLPMDELKGIPISIVPSDQTSTFENIYTQTGRIQYLHHRANDLTIESVPEIWKKAPIIHLGPLTNEVDLGLISAFPKSQVNLTPQGWMRKWNDEGKVTFRDWPDEPALYHLSNTTSAVLSIEDIESNEDRVEFLAAHVPILVVTEGAAGARLYWNGDLRRFRPPVMREVDPLGAGDVFAAAFFYRLFTTQDPWEAARFATNLAAYSVTRVGISGVPTTQEVNHCLVDILA
jgi:sugar/nucleoside kinase (ribokinase family)